MGTAHSIFVGKTSPSLKSVDTTSMVGIRGSETRMSDSSMFGVPEHMASGISDWTLIEIAGTISVVALERKMKGKQVAFYALDAANP